MSSECFLCGSRSSRIIHNGTRDNPSIDVLKCCNCGLVRLSDIMDDPDAYYENAEMRADDTEVSLEEIRVSAAIDDERRFEFVKRIAENKAVLDFGCGAGGVLHRLKRVASSVCGVELERDMCEAINREGIRCYPSVDVASKELTESVDIITAFHVLEHLENPIEMLNRLKVLLKDDGIMVIEIPNADDALLGTYNNGAFADFTYWSAHLYLYNNETFKKLIERAGLKVRFISQIQRYSLSNTLYWLAKGKPGGHKKWAMLSNGLLDREYESQLAKLGIADTIIAIVEKG